MLKCSICSGHIIKAHAARKMTRKFYRNLYKCFNCGRLFSIAGKRTESIVNKTLSFDTTTGAAFIN